MSCRELAWPSIFGTRHLGSLGGVTSLVGIFGATAGRLLSRHGRHK
jgi:hypothetical protein